MWQKLAHLHLCLVKITCLTFGELLPSIVCHNSINTGPTLVFQSLHKALYCCNSWYYADWNREILYQKQLDVSSNWCDNADILSQVYKSPVWLYLGQLKWVCNISQTTWNQEQWNQELFFKGWWSFEHNLNIFEFKHFWNIHCQSIFLTIKHHSILAVGNVLHSNIFTYHYMSNNKENTISQLRE